MLKEKDLINYIADLKQLVAIDSPSNNIEGINKIIEFCKTHIQALKLNCIELKANELDCPCLLITNVDNVYEDNIDVLMLAHMDTVYPLGTASMRGFTIKNNQAFAPGVIDDKGGLLLGLYALHNIDLKNTKIAFFINANEEVGSKYNCDFIKNIATQAKVCLCLEAAREDGALVGARFGVAEYEVNIQQVADSKKVIGQHFESPLVIMSYLVSTLSSYNEISKQVFIDFKVVNDETSFINHKNITLKILVRFMNKELLDLADNMINQTKMFNNNVISVNVEQKNIYPAMEDSAESKKVKFLVEYLGKANYIDIKWQNSFGGSDACFASAVNCPTIDGLGPIGGNFHSEDEYIDLSSVIPRGNLLIDIINYFATNIK